MLNGPVGGTLLRLAAPMAVGIAAIILFTVVDTFFVGQLGSRQLAAMSFCFPVNFVVYSIVMGIGIGTTSVIARAIGEGDRAKVRRLATDALLLAGTLVLLVAGTCFLFLDEIFAAMGADADLMPMIRAYMVPWLGGVGLLMIPMVGNSAIRATGDTKSPAVIMMISGVANVVLDPLLIFGLGPFPRLELRGAAIATVISWAITFVAALYLLIRRERMIERRIPRLSEVWESWRAILYVGLPAAGTNLLMPLAAGVLTRLAAGYGTATVAAYGVGTRLDMLSMVGINALSTALTPFVGQNYGAGRRERVEEAARFSMRASLVFGIGIAAIYGLGAGPIARIFNDEAAVTDAAAHYLRIVPLAYGFAGVGVLVNTIFIALNQPGYASLLMVIRLFVFNVPIAYAGSTLFGITGFFAGIAVGMGLIAPVAFLMIRRHLGSLEAGAEAQPAPAS
jgi:MATE family, multidrug efflux pump